MTVTPSHDQAVWNIETRGLSKRFGGVIAVDVVDFRAGENEIVGLIGPNGAGKTTLFNLMAGFAKPDDGDIYLNGERINGRKPFEIARMGIARTFQICKPFAELSVLENVITGAYVRAKNYREAVDISEDALRSLDIYGKRLQLARHLTLPDLKRLEVARALATGPRILLLDEVMAGLNLREQHQVAAMVETIHQSGVGIVLVEHSIAMIVRLSKRIIVLDDGRKIAEGEPREVIKTAAVRAAYLGIEDDK